MYTNAFEQLCTAMTTTPVLIFANMGKPFTVTTDAIVLDPFCGCGTTVATAQRLKRRWLEVLFKTSRLMTVQIIDTSHIDCSQCSLQIGVGQSAHTTYLNMASTGQDSQTTVYASFVG